MGRFDGRLRYRLKRRSKLAGRVQIPCAIVGLIELPDDFTDDQVILATARASKWSSDDHFR
jgi:hypothetical protein